MKMKWLLGVLVAIVFLSGCAANNSALREGDDYGSEYADRVDVDALSLNRNQQLCMAGKLPMINIGRDPVNPHQFDPRREALYKVKVPLYVRTRGGKNKKEIFGCISPGTMLAVDQQSGRVSRIYECGNPVFNDIFLPVKNAATGRKGKDQSLRAKNEKDCLTVGNVATGLGTVLLSFGLSTGEPTSITTGAILSLTGLFDDKVYGSNSNQRCKTAFGIVGGIGGYFGGQSYNNAHKDDGSSGGDNGDNNGNNDSNGPAEPPAVP